MFFSDCRTLGDQGMSGSVLCGNRKLQEGFLQGSNVRLRRNFIGQSIGSEKKCIFPMLGEGVETQAMVKAFTSRKRSHIL